MTKLIYMIMLLITFFVALHCQEGDIDVIVQPKQFENCKDQSCVDRNIPVVLDEKKRLLSILKEELIKRGEEHKYDFLIQEMDQYAK